MILTPSSGACLAAPTCADALQCSLLCVRLPVCGCVVSNEKGPFYVIARDKGAQ